MSAQKSHWIHLGYWTQSYLWVVVLLLVGWLPAPEGLTVRGSLVLYSGIFLAFPMMILVFGPLARPARKSDLWGYLVIAVALALAAFVFWIKVRP